MVFKTLTKIWKKESLLNTALKETHNMFNEDRRMFEIAINGLFENKKIDKSVYLMDKKVNQYEIDMRKKILEHLAINPKQDLTASLILIGVIKDIERIGDYCKNIADLNKSHPEKLENGKYVKELTKAKNSVLELFETTIQAFENSDKDKAREAIELHNSVNPELKKIRLDIMNEKKMNVRKAVVYALLARYLRRISAHLTNIASTVAKPFHRVGYRE